MTDNERRVLESLLDAEDYCGFCFLNFATLIADTGLDRKQVKHACRSLKRKGLAEFGRGLWTEDGDPAGSGYAATKAARQTSEAAQSAVQPTEPS